MNKLFNKLDGALNGWLTTGCLIIIEIIIVYILSNIPFFLATLEIPINSEHDPGFLINFINVMKNEINKGQILTFVCALIAPVVFWSFAEFRKAIMTKALSLFSLFLLILTVYVHGKGDDFQYVSSFRLYQAALLIWVLSILSNRIPPDKNAYFNITNHETDDFLEATKRG